MTSPEWNRFIDNFFNDRMTMFHDGIDPTSANDLKGEEREKGEDMLIASMKEGSFWAPMGLREMGSKKAIPVMKEIFDSSHERLKIEIAYALNVLQNSMEYVPYLVEALKSAGSWNRMIVARMLRNYNTPDVIDALFDSIEDTEYLVRRNCCESLLYIHKLPASISEYEEIASDVIASYDVIDEEKRNEACKRYKRAAEMLRELIDKESG